MGDLADDDRGHGMGIVVEYANAKGEPQWSKPRPFKWDYTIFGKASVAPASPDETFDVTVVKHNGALNGFNQWLLNGEAFLCSASRSDGHAQQSRMTRRRLRFRTPSAARLEGKRQPPGLLATADEVIE